MATAFQRLPLIKTKRNGLGVSQDLKPLSSSSSTSTTFPQPTNNAPVQKMNGSSSNTSNQSKRRDNALGAVEITIHDGDDLYLPEDSHPYVLCNFENVYSSTSQPTSWNGQVAPVWNSTAKHDLTTENPRMQFLLYQEHEGDDKLLGAASVFLSELGLQEGVRHEVQLPMVNVTDQSEHGRLRISVTYLKEQSKASLGPDHFEILATLGHGSYGTVYKVRKRDTRRLYAMKVLSKAAIAQSKTASHVISERRILQLFHMQNTCSFLVGLKFAFQTETHLYFIMDLKSGGELFQHMQHEGGRFDESRVRFYIAEILLAIETLHANDTIYRDLKPENILLDDAGHVALCDFGLAKTLKKGERTRTFCGTPEYLSPEVINEEGGYDGRADYWALGILMYEMLTGYTPFYSEDRYDKFEKITKGQFKIPKRGISAEACDLLTKLLEREPEKRLGQTAEEVKSHPFFKSIDWQALSEKRITPPFKPFVNVDDDPDYNAQRTSSVADTVHTPGLSTGASAASTLDRWQSSRRSSCEDTSAVVDEEEDDKKVDWWRDFTFSRPDSRKSSVSSNLSNASFSVGLSRGLSLSKNLGMTKAYDRA